MGIQNAAKVPTMAGTVSVDVTDTDRVVVTFVPKDPQRARHAMRVTNGEVVTEYWLGKRPPVLHDEVTMRDESGVMRTFEVCGTRMETDGSYYVQDERGAWLRWED